jgi:plastocyanin
MGQRLIWLALLAASLIFSRAAYADIWQMQVGAESGNKAHQALAFLPNEIWIHAGDTITWSFPAHEIHTVTFLMPKQVRPSRFDGCPGPPAGGGMTPDGRTPDFSVVDTNKPACVNSGIRTTNDGATYSVVFPSAGNFKLVCLAHPNMTGTVHVLDSATPLPHDQAFYDKLANRGSADLLSDVMASGHDHSDRNQVTAGVGHIMGNGGGTQTASVMRFMDANKVIHVGDTVEWTTAEAVTSHTITFGPEPDIKTANVPSGTFTIEADGALHAFLSSPSDALNSGFITQAPQDRTNLAQAPLGVTRFRVTFTAPGVYPYKCVLHDELGMVGQVVVLP